MAGTPLDGRREPGLWRAREAHWSRMMTVHFGVLMVASGVGTTRFDTSLRCAVGSVDEGCCDGRYRLPLSRPETVDIRCVPHSTPVEGRQNG